MKPPKRVLLTLHAPDCSGVAFSAQNLIAGMRPRQIQVMAMTRASGERKNVFEDLNVRVAVAPHFGRLLLGRGAVSSARAFGPEIVHAQDLDVVAPSHSLARSLGVPLIVTVNRLDEAHYPFLSAHPEVGVIAVSDAILERLTNRAGVSRDRIHCIPNGLDLSRFPAPDLDQVPDGRRVWVVGTYGTFTEQKGQRVFLQAASEVLGRGMDVEFLLMGHGPDKPKLRQLAEGMGIKNRVTFAPSTSTDNRNLGNVDVFVEPSYQEGLGLSVLQAMAAGIPVIASGVGGIFNLVQDGQTGVLVPKGDASALAGAIQRLLEDPQQRIEMARRARERVEEAFDIHQVAKQVLEVYASQLAARGGGDG